MSNPESAYLKFINDRMPLDRWGDAEDFKGPVIFLGLNASSYGSGKILLVRPHQLFGDQFVDIVKGRWWVDGSLSRKYPLIRIWADGGRVDTNDRVSHSQCSFIQYLFLFGRLSDTLNVELLSTSRKRIHINAIPMPIWARRMTNWENKIRRFR
jgi:hypothetical protein